MAVLLIPAIAALVLAVLPSYRLTAYIIDMAPPGKVQPCHCKEPCNCPQTDLYHDWVHTGRGQT